MNSLTTEQKFTVSKSTVECYKIRHANGMYWADITIDAKDKTGRIQIASDFGDWQNYWGACGTDFKTFLASLDKYYAGDKFNADRWFDHAKTLAGFRSHLDDVPKTDRTTARKEIKELEDYVHEEEFKAHLYDCDTLMRLFDNCPDIVRGLTPGFLRFWEMIWPVLLNEFKQETAEVNARLTS
jgi:hypothetical protein